MTSPRKTDKQESTKIRLCIYTCILWGALNANWTQSNEGNLTDIDDPHSMAFPEKMDGLTSGHFLG